MPGAVGKLPVPVNFDRHNPWTRRARFIVGRPVARRAQRAVVARPPGITPARRAGNGEGGGIKHLNAPWDLRGNVTGVRASSGVSISVGSADAVAAADESATRVTRTTRVRLRHPRNVVDGNRVRHSVDVIVGVVEEIQGYIKPVDDAI